MYDPGIGRWISEDPIGFKAGDSNLYRYVANNPVNGTDPSGLVYGWNSHSYPLWLGGSGNQIVADLSGISRADGIARHNAAHRFLTQHGFGPTAAGQARWAALTRRQQQAMIMRSMRVAGIANSWIRANIGNIMTGANAGVATPRPSGFPGGVARVPLISLAGAAILNILLDPSVAHAGQLDPTWRGLPEDRQGRVEVTERLITYDLPRTWYLLGDRIYRGSVTLPEWMDLGEMTVREAREFEGIDEVHEGGIAFALPPVPFGYYRITVVRSVARFNGHDQESVPRQSSVPRHSGTSEGGDW
jgi:hypothetical protein